MFELIKPSLHIDFIGKYRLFFLISGAFVAAAILLIVLKGFTYGVDFAGGTLAQVKYNATSPLTDVLRNELNKAYKSDDYSIQSGDNNLLLIRISAIAQDKKSINDVAGSIQSSLTAVYGENNFEVLKIEQIGPQVGDELKSSALFAILYALLGILVYVAIRFEFIYSVGAILALFHDVIITLGIFSLFGINITLEIVAGVLTIIGYSLNDTIVIFDRIRETQDKFRGRTDTPIKDILNVAINQTLSRTIITSGTTLLAAVALLIFGGSIIHGFALAIVCGVAVGTYSSIGIASALVYVFVTKYGTGMLEKKIDIDKSQPIL